MAITCDATLSNSASCLECGIPPGMENSVIIYLLCQIAGMNCDAQTLVDGAKCLECGIPPGMERAVMIYLLCQITNGGGVGGGGLAGAGSPEGVVTANPGTTYTQTDTGSFWTKLTGVGNTGWLELIV